MSKDEDLHMWSCWRDKYGELEAVERRYPEAAKEPQIAAAIAQVKNGLLVIDTLMKRKESEAQDAAWD